MRLRDIGPGLGGGQPARRLQAFQFLAHGLERQGGCAVLRPQHIAVEVIAVMVGVEDVFDGLTRKPLHVRHGGAGAAGIVGIDDDHIILHLDDYVVAMTLVQIAFAEPDSGHDPPDSFRIGIRPRDE